MYYYGIIVYNVVLFDRDILESNLAMIGTNGQLIIPSVNRHHEGEWSCKVNYTFGSSEFKNKLTVKSIEGKLMCHIQSVVTNS